MSTVAHANRCPRCNQRLARPDGQRLYIRTLDIRQGVLWLQCRCGEWNQAPAELCTRLRVLLSIAS